MLGTGCRSIQFRQDREVRDVLRLDHGNSDLDSDIASTVIARVSTKPNSAVSPVAELMKDTIPPRSTEGVTKMNWMEPALFVVFQGFKISAGSFKTRTVGRGSSMIERVLMVIKGSVARTVLIDGSRGLGHSFLVWHCV